MRVRGSTEVQVHFLPVVFGVINMHLYMFNIFMLTKLSSSTLFTL